MYFCYPFRALQQWGDNDEKMKQTREEKDVEKYTAPPAPKPKQAPQPRGRVYREGVEEKRVKGEMTLK